MKTHKHHVVAKSRGGSEDWWNYEEKDAYQHAYDHAVDFVLFDNAPVFDCRHEAWPFLPDDLKNLVKAKLSDLLRKRWSHQKGENHPQYGLRGEKSVNYGKRHTAESREKMSQAQKGKPKSKEHIEKMVENFKNRPPTSPETKEKLSKALKGRPKSEDHKQKISEASMGNQRWLGRKHSEETIRKMSESAKNRKRK